MYANGGMHSTGLG